MAGRSLLRAALERLHGAHAAILDVAGLALLSGAAGMLNAVAGVAAAGVSCLLVSWRSGA